jgi:hypothetical protein
MTASPRNLALAGVVAIYLALIAILAGAVWDDHAGSHHVVSHLHHAG